MAKMKDTIAILALVFGIVLVGGIIGGVVMMSTAVRTPVDEPFRGESVFCANNPALNGEFRIRDALASDTTYLNGTLLVRNERSGQVREVTVVADGADYTGTMNLECGNPEGYTIFVDGSGDALNSHDAVKITPAELDAGVIDISKTVMASVFSAPTVEGMFDRRGNDFTTIGDDALYVEIELRIAPNTAFGSSGYVALTVDDEAEVWDIDTLQVSYNGRALTKATLSADESRALRNKEAVFALPDGIGTDGQRVVSFEVRAQPHANYEYDALDTDDVVFELIARGDVEDDEEVLKAVGFRGDSWSDNINTIFVETLTH